MNIQGIILKSLQFFSYANIFLKKNFSFYLCVRICVCVHPTCADTGGGQKRTLSSLELGLQVVVSCLTWRRDWCILNPWAMLSSPPVRMSMGLLAHHSGAMVLGVPTMLCSCVNTNINPCSLYYSRVVVHTRQNGLQPHQSFMLFLYNHLHPLPDNNWFLLLCFYRSGTQRMLQRWNSATLIRKVSWSLIPVADYVNGLFLSVDDGCFLPCAH